MSLILLQDVEPFTARNMAGRVLPFATLDFYKSGTTEPAPLGDELDGHFEADAGGVFPEIELELSESYRVVHKTADGALVFDVDPYVCTCGEEAEPGVFRSPIQRAFTDAGVIVPGAKLYSFAVDGETPVALYADAALSVPLPNPVVANAAGVFPHALYSDDAETYVLELTDADGNLLESFDPYACTCVAPPVPEFAVTIGNLDNFSFGYLDAGDFGGSIDPTPPTVYGAVLRDLSSDFQAFRVRFVDGAAMPDEVSTIEIETAGGTVELDAHSPSVTLAGNDYRWFAGADAWTIADESEVRQVRFVP